MPFAIFCFSISVPILIVKINQNNRNFLATVNIPTAFTLSLSDQTPASRSHITIIAHL